MRSDMPVTLRLNDWEQDEIRKKAVEINKALVKAGKQPLKDSELTHEILKKAIPQVRVSASGEIEIG